jgi:hypothetical protein
MKNALTGSKNTGSTSPSQGIAGATGNQGDPNGDANSNKYGPGGGPGNSGISYNLGGRGHQKLTMPIYNINEEGKVVVEIRVNKDGKVIQATPGVTRGNEKTTILHEYLYNAAKKAALETQFEANPSAPEVQVGTITYNFKLK